MAVPQSFRGHHCADCGDPISPYSRGRCRKCAYIGLKREVPDDFALVLRKLGSQGSAKFYEASLSTITRWRREIGMRPQERARKPSMPSFNRRGFTERPLLANRDLSLPGQAAEFLRRYGSVYRCEESGKPNPKGICWKRNFSILTDAEIIARAERLGWAPMGL